MEKVAKNDKIDKTRIIYEIIKILAEAKVHINITDITNKLNETLEHWDVTTKPRLVKEYISIIENSFDYGLDVKRGPDGGYLLSNKWRDSIAELATLQLSTEERNALNDAFEIALRSSTYFYSKQLKAAKTKLYTKTNLKDNDNEFYVGKNLHREQFEDFVYKFKHAAVNKLYVEMAFKYEYYGYPIQEERYKPLYIVHDPDESFIFIKSLDDKVYIQNVLNIKSIKVTDKVFVDSSIKKIEEYINDFTINIKGEHPLKFKIKTDRGRMIFDLWNYEFEDKSFPNSDVKEIVFYEQYILLEFLFRMQKHIEIIDIHPKDKEEWNEKVEDLEVIK